MPEFSFSGFAENLPNASSLSGLNTIVQVFEAPAQLDAQGSTDATLAGAHEAHQEHRPYRNPFRWRQFDLTMGTGSSSHAYCCRTAARRTAKLFQRFLRWILPLKESNLTEDAAFPAVPTRERALSMGKEIWLLGKSGKSFSTCPLTDRAITSIEA